MSTESEKIRPAPVPVESPVTMRELAGILVKHYGINDGLFDLMVEYTVGTGAIGPDKQTAAPGMMIGVSKVGLVPSAEGGLITVDASAVNPAKTRRKANAAS